MGSGVELSTADGLRRFLAVDEDGRGLRVTWRPAHGFVNVSLWDGTTCTATFHLTPTAAAELIGFLAGAFAGSLPATSRPSLRAVAAESETSGHQSRVASAVGRVRDLGRTVLDLRRRRRQP